MEVMLEASAEPLPGASTVFPSVGAFGSSDSGGFVVSAEPWFSVSEFAEVESARRFARSRTAGGKGENQHKT